MTPSMNAIDILVTDVRAAIDFYRQLGLAFEIDANMPGHAGCDLPNGVHLMLDTVESRKAFTPGWQDPAGSPRNFLAFALPSPAEVDTTYAELVKAGHRGLTEPWDAYWGMRYATVADPDGNGVDLYATLPSD